MQEENNRNTNETTTIPEMVDEVRTGRLPRRAFIKTLAAMGVSAVGITAISASAARPTVSRPAAPIHTSNNANDHIKLHDTHLAHQSQGNIDKLHHDYAHNAIVEDSMYAQPFVGRAAIMARKGVGMAAIPNLKITPTNRLVHGNQLTVEWVATGVHTGDFPGLPASGRSFSFSGVTVVVRHEGKIMRESIYYDMEDVRRQLGTS